MVDGLTHALFLADVEREHAGGITQLATDGLILGRIAPRDDHCRSGRAQAEGHGPPEPTIAARDQGDSAFQCEERIGHGSPTPLERPGPAVGRFDSA